MKNQVVLLPLFLTIVNVYFAKSAKILGIVAMPSYSHQVVFRPLWRELSLRGHQVTVLTTDPMKDPALKNLTEVDLHYSYDIVQQHDAVNYVANHKYEIWKIINKTEMSEAIVTYQMSHPEVARLIHDENEHFDLVLVELFFVSHMGK